MLFLGQSTFNLPVLLTLCCFWSRIQTLVYQT